MYWWEQIHQRTHAPGISAKRLCRSYLVKDSSEKSFSLYQSPSWMNAVRRPQIVLKRPWRRKSFPFYFFSSRQPASRTHLVLHAFSRALQLIDNLFHIPLFLHVRVTLFDHAITHQTSRLLGVILTISLQCGSAGKRLVQPYCIWEHHETLLYKLKLEALQGNCIAAWKPHRFPELICMNRIRTSLHLGHSLRSQTKT